MFVELLSKYDWEKSVELVTEKIDEAGWKLLATHNLQQSLKNFDYEVKPIKVIELCNPHLANKVLSIDELRLYSNLMPCRISVYEKTDGNTYLSLMNAGELASQLDEKMKNVMNDVYKESLEILKSIVEK